MSKAIRFNLGFFDPDVHRLARIRAVEKRVTLKYYIRGLILDDVKRVEESRAAQQSQAQEGRSES